MPVKITLSQPGFQRRWTALEDEGVSDGGDPYVGYDYPRSQTRDDLRDGFAFNEPLIAAKQCPLPLVDDLRGGCAKVSAVAPWQCPRSKTRNDLQIGFAFNKPLIAAKLSVAIADASGQIVERYAFSAFGITTILTPGVEARSGNQSDFDWNLLFHVESTDESTGWMNCGCRFYVPAPGRLLSRDPVGLGGGLNLYGFVGNGPLSAWEYLGMMVIRGYTRCK